MAAIPPVTVLFSDLDGTLVHYPKELNAYATITPHATDATTVTITYNETNEQRVCTILTSKTGGPSYISNRTLDHIAQLRSLGVIFVIITGARASTYIKRRPFLPKSDFEFYENGGRMIRNGDLVPEWSDAFISETGKIEDRVALLPQLKTMEERDGMLWDLYRKMDMDGWKLDARDYATNFRVDVAHSVGKTQSEFETVVREEVGKRGLATSFNLGKADFYPAGSGKANAAKRVLDELGIGAEEAVAMFDDDNDLELGRLCGRAFLPGVTHPSVLKELKVQPSWTLAERKGVLGTESALEAIIELRKNTLKVEAAAE